MDESASLQGNVSASVRSRPHSLLWSGCVSFADLGESAFLSFAADSLQSIMAVLLPAAQCLDRLSGWTDSGLSAQDLFEVPGIPGHVIGIEIAEKRTVLHLSRVRHDLDGVEPHEVPRLDVHDLHGVVALRLRRGKNFLQHLS